MVSEGETVITNGIYHRFLSERVDKGTSPPSPVNISPLIQFISLSSMAPGDLFHWNDISITAIRAVPVSFILGEGLTEMLIEHCFSP